MRIANSANACYFMAIITLVLIVGTKAALGKGIRNPAVSGSFYPSTTVELISMIKDFLAVNINDDLSDKEIMGIIVPHAGYVYSGRTAGYGFSAIKGKDYDEIILLGPSHRRYLDAPVMCSFSGWHTPLGKVQAVCGQGDGILYNTDINIDDNIFVQEHSLEVELPFLQCALKNNFNIIPLLVNDFRIENLKTHAHQLAENIKKRNKVLLVMSTDMSHYYRAAEALLMDSKASEIITDMDLNSLEKYLLDKSVQLCGAGGVMLGLLTLRELGAEGVIKLDYSHSGMITGDNSKVVGYGTFAIYKSKKEKIKKMGLNNEQKIKLLEIARKTIETYVREGRKIQFNVEDTALMEERGVFVTLHKKGQLRGCIGNIMPVSRLHVAVRDMAIQSSTNDPRFTVLKEEELDDIEIEISVLTVPKKVSNYDEIVLGRDGVIVKKGFHQGVYLPQVADETGWSKEEFLNSLCYSKAGLSPDSWKNPETELYIFQAEVFNEKELGIR